MYRTIIRFTCQDFKKLSLDEIPNLLASFRKNPTDPHLKAATSWVLKSIEYLSDEHCQELVRIHAKTDFLTASQSSQILERFEKVDLRLLKLVCQQEKWAHHAIRLLNTCDPQTFKEVENFVSCWTYLKNPPCLRNILDHGFEMMKELSDSHEVCQQIRFYSNYLRLHPNPVVVPVKWKPFSGSVAVNLLSLHRQVYTLGLKKNTQSLDEIDTAILSNMEQIHLKEARIVLHSCRVLKYRGATIPLMISEMMRHVFSFRPKDFCFLISCLRTLRVSDSEIYVSLFQAFYQNARLNSHEDGHYLGLFCWHMVRLKVNEPNISTKIVELCRKSHQSLRASDSIRILHALARWKELNLYSQLFTLVEPHIEARDLHSNYLASLLWSIAVTDQETSLWSKLLETVDIRLTQFSETSLAITALSLCKRRNLPNLLMKLHRIVYSRVIDFRTHNVSLLFMLYVSSRFKDEAILSRYLHVLRARSNLQLQDYQNLVIGLTGSYNLFEKQTPVFHELTSKMRGALSMQTSVPLLNVYILGEDALGLSSDERLGLRNLLLDKVPTMTKSRVLRIFAAIAKGRSENDDDFGRERFFARALFERLYNFRGQVSVHEMLSLLEHVYRLRYWNSKLLRFLSSETVQLVDSYQVPISVIAANIEMIHFFDIFGKFAPKTQLAIWTNLSTDWKQKISLQPIPKSKFERIRGLVH